MPSATPVTPQPLNDDFPDKDAQPAGIWVELLSIPLLGFCIWIAVSYWRHWLRSTDCIIYVCCVVLGILVAIARANKVGFCSRWRLPGTQSLWIIGVVLLSASLLTSRNDIAVIASAVVFAGWCSGRITGERFGFALSLGLAMASPVLIDLAVSNGWFSWLESATLSVTSGLADIAGQSHIREDHFILFANGVADRFSCIGTVDGLLSFLGFSVFIALVMRRGLIAGGISIVISCLVWQSTRASAITIVAFYPSQVELWHDWSPTIIAIVMCIGIILIAGLDQFVAAISEPIPFEFLNVDFPVLALAWNWIWGLPTLVVRVPQRESDFGPMETDE